MVSKKDAILTAATDLFSKYGYHSVGIDRIIAEASIAKMTLYKHFPSKENLIEETLKNRDTDLRTSILAAVESHQNPTEKLKSIFDWYAHWFGSNDFHGCMFIKAAEEFPDTSPNIVAVSQAHKRWLTELIKSLLIDIGSKNESLLASHIMVILDGLTVSANMFHQSNNKQTVSAWTYVESLLQQNAA